MSEPRITLLTLDMPANRGGVARYLGGLVAAAGGEICVLDANARIRETWLKWWPLVAVCRGEGTKERVLLISHVFPVGTAAWLAHFFGGAEYAVLFHGLDLRLARDAWKRWLLRRICGSAKALLVNSQSTLHDLHALVPNAHATVLTPGIDPNGFSSREAARQKLNLEPNEKIVLSVARLVPRKGIDHSLHAMAQVQTRQDVSYVVIGDGPDRERLQQIATERRCHVRWIRDAKDEEVRNWFAAADLFLLPVRDEGFDVEGFGIVYLEAAAAGIPSIAGRSGGATEAVRHERTGLVVDPDDVPKITGAIERLLQDGELRHELGQEGKVRILNEFRWAERWDKLREVMVKR